MVIKRMKCVRESGDLKKDKIYTVLFDNNEKRPIFCSVKEIKNYNNSFFIHRFVDIKAQLPKNINIL